MSKEYPNSPCIDMYHHVRIIKYYYVEHVIGIGFT